jgi:dihydroorotate dehydrogenase (NAD+) catalytic subunit
MFPYTLWPAYRRLLAAVRDTKATVFTKSATRHPRVGNLVLANPLTWRYIRRLPQLGMLNAYGLTNDGAAKVAPGIRRACDAGWRVIPNFYPEFAKGTETALRETLEAVALYSRALGTHFQALELNFSCPNAAEAIRENVGQALHCVRGVRRAAPGLALVAKVSLCHPYDFSQELERLGVFAIHAVNTIPYELVFPLGPPSPLADAGGGGVSGGPAFELAYAYNRELRKKVNCFLIMGCGVTSREDVQRYFDLGADAVSFCTLALRRPGEAERVVRQFAGGVACNPECGGI